MLTWALRWCVYLRPAYTLIVQIVLRARLVNQRSHLMKISLNLLVALLAMLLRPGRDRLAWVGRAPMPQEAFERVEQFVAPPTDQDFLNKRVPA